MINSKRWVFIFVFFVLYGINFLNAQSGEKNVDSLTNDIANEISIIKTSQIAYDKIIDQINTTVNSHEAEKIKQEEERRNGQLNKGLLTQEDYEETINSAKRKFADEAKQERQAAMKEMQDELNSKLEEKADAEKRKNNLISELVNSEFTLDVKKVENTSFNPESKTFTLTVTIPEFDNEEIKVLYTIVRYPNENARAVARRAAAEDAKSFVAKVKYKVTLHETEENTYYVHIKNVDIYEPGENGLIVVPGANIDIRSKKFLAGQLFHKPTPVASGSVQDDKTDISSIKNDGNTGSSNSPAWVNENTAGEKSCYSFGLYGAVYFLDFKFMQDIYMQEIYEDIDLFNGVAAYIMWAELNKKQSFTCVSAMFGTSYSYSWKNGIGGDEYGISYHNLEIGSAYIGVNIDGSGGLYTGLGLGLCWTNHEYKYGYYSFQKSSGLDFLLSIHPVVIEGRFSDTFNVWMKYDLDLTLSGLPLVRHYLTVGLGFSF